MKVFVVDDSKAMRNRVRQTLRELGIDDADVHEAANGSEALAQMGRETPDLVLSDWMMPEMGGVELLRELRQRHLEVPFGFVVDERPSPHMEETARLAGAQFVVEAPLTPDQLRSALADRPTDRGGETEPPSRT